MSQEGFTCSTVLESWWLITEFTLEEEQISKYHLECAKIHISDFSSSFRWQEQKKTTFLFKEGGFRGDFGLFFPCRLF